MKEENNQSFIDGQNIYMNRRLMDGKKKGNVDTDIVYMILTKLLDKEDFDNVILVSGDGDYYRTVKYLIDHKRFKKLLTPNRHSTSSLYRKLSPKYIDYLDKKEIKAKISIKKAGSS